MYNINFLFIKKVKLLLKMWENFNRMLFNISDNNILIIDFKNVLLIFYLTIFNFIKKIIELFKNINGDYFISNIFKFAANKCLKAFIDSSLSTSCNFMLLKNSYPIAIVWRLFFSSDLTLEVFSICFLKKGQYLG